MTTIKKGVLQLNNALPEDISFTWCTAEEICRRLIHAGVNDSLTLEMVQDSLRYNNSGEKYLKKWEYNNINYFRSALAHSKDENSLPNVQRFKLGKSTGRGCRVNIDSPRNFFVGKGISTFDAVNDALEKLGEEREKEKSKYLVYTSALFLFRQCLSLICNYAIVLS